MYSRESLDDASRDPRPASEWDSRKFQYIAGIKKEIPTAFAEYRRRIYGEDAIEYAKCVADKYAKHFEVGDLFFLLPSVRALLNVSGTSLPRDPNQVVFIRRVKPEYLDQENKMVANNPYAVAKIRDHHVLEYGPLIASSTHESGDDGEESECSALGGGESDSNETVQLRPVEREFAGGEVHYVVAEIPKYKEYPMLVDGGLNFTVQLNTEALPNIFDAEDPTKVSVQVSLAAVLKYGGKIHSDLLWPRSVIVELPKGTRLPFEYVSSQI